MAQGIFPVCGTRLSSAGHISSEGRFTVPLPFRKCFRGLFRHSSIQGRGTFPLPELRIGARFEDLPGFRVETRAPGISKDRIFGVPPSRIHVGTHGVLVAAKIVDTGVIPPALTQIGPDEAGQTLSRESGLAWRAVPLSSGVR
jgi:hypothetical protein